MTTTIAINPADLERQLALEAEMLTDGQLRLINQIGKARDGDRESETVYGTAILKRLIEPVSRAITAFKADAESGKAGRRHAAIKFLREIESDTAAFIALRTVLDCITKKVTLQGVAVAIASGIEGEVRWRFFKQADARAYKWAAERAQNSKDKRYAKRVLANVMNKANVEWEPWTEDRVHLGIKMVEIIRETTGLIDTQRRTDGPNNTPIYVVATEKTLSWIDEKVRRSALMSPIFMPTIVPPKKWEGVTGGGYYDASISTGLIKTRNRNFLEELSNLNLDTVYEAVNRMQNTAYKINAKVLTTMQQCIERDLTIGDLPLKEGTALPPKPHDIAENEEARKVWRRTAARVHVENAKRLSKAIQLSKTIYVADRFQNEAAIYFPMQLDFRGRAYCIPSFLNPQGADYAKALLTFANGKPINDETASMWLAVTGSNLYGNDKVSLEDREQWVYDNEDMIFAVAADPLNDTRWNDADQPWQFLAWCFEWSAFKAQGWGFVSSFPCGMDATASGIQHFSAMLRDEVGGSYVNLIPAAKPQDIYGRVAARVVEKLCLIPSTDDTFALAQKWMAFGINRKTTKRAVMVLPYGGTRYSCRDFIEEFIRDQLSSGAENLFRVSDEKDGVFEASMFLAGFVWESIGDVVVGARTAMDWLQQAASLAAAEGLPVTWRCPDGFYVQQAYPEYKSRRIKTTMLGSIIKLSLSEETGRLDKNRQRNGISPNFVHSMDACQLRLTICYAAENGVESFAMVHDSYATVAADTAMLAASLRYAFCEMYEVDVLSEFRGQIEDMLSDKAKEKLPAVPDMGSLDLEVVKKSDFFFA